MPAPVKWKPTLGTFSKALPGAIALNFAESGGVNCSDECQAKDKFCYAEQVEKMKPSVATSGERKRLAGFAECCNAYAAEIRKRAAKGHAFPWIRFSSFGSVPNRPLSPVEILAFIQLVRSFPPGVPVHFPVETKEKAMRFRAIANHYGLKLVVRESAQSENRALECLAEGSAASLIFSAGRNKRERLAGAIAYAKGKPGAKVCPAIASTILRRPVKIKCGSGKGGCTACSQDSGLVIYPQH